jgi:Flp pilus assembly protein TadD
MSRHKRISRARRAGPAAKIATVAEPTRPERIPRARRVALLVGGALALGTLLVYSPTFQYPFIELDDPRYVLNNRNVRGGLTADGIRWAFTSFHASNWHPLTWLSLQLDASLYGGRNAGGFHFTNVLLHVANTLLLFGVLRRLTGAVWRSAVVAALFALHPLHVESVAWVTERKDVLSTLFWMLSLAAYLGYVRRPGMGRYLLVVVALGLGLLAKAMLVTLPCVLLLLDYWPLRRGQRGPGTGPGAAPATRPPPVPSWRLLLLEKAPLFALVLAACIVTSLAQRQALGSFENYPLAVRIENALLAYVTYLGQMLWPLRLAVYYPHPGTSVSVAAALGAGLLLAVLTALVLVPGRRWPYLAVGWFWYLGTLVPVIGLVQVGGQAMADRYTYVPSIGLFLALVWGISDLAQAWRVPRPGLVLGTALVLATCAVLTGTQVSSWQSTQHLWEHAVAVTEKNAEAHISLGAYYCERGRLAEAQRELEKAMAIAPQSARPHVNLGNVFSALGRGQEALAAYHQAIALNPKNPKPHFNVGNLFAEQGRFDEAVAELHQAIALNPDDGLPHNNLGSVLLQLGRVEEALAECQQAVTLDPDDAMAHNNLGIMLVELGRYGEAEAAFRQALALDPKKPAFHMNLGKALQETGRLVEAQTEFRRALDLGDQRAAGLLQACTLLPLLRQRLPAVGAGREQPADNAQRLALADLARQPFEQRYALAARLYDDALRAAPSLADNLGAGQRFQAARAAAAAGCGQGQDSAGLGEQEKARLRQQALTWLQADLAGWSSPARSASPQAAAGVQQALRRWQRAAELAAVRDAAALAQLPTAERDAWQQFWSTVEALLTQASTPQQAP